MTHAVNELRELIDRGVREEVRLRMLGATCCLRDLRNHAALITPQEFLEFLSAAQAFLEAMRTQIREPD